MEACHDTCYLDLSPCLPTPLQANRLAQIVHLQKELAAAKGGQPLAASDHCERAQRDGGCAYWLAGAVVVLPACAAGRVTILLSNRTYRFPCLQTTTAPMSSCSRS